MEENNDYAKGYMEAWDNFVQAARKMLRYCHPHQRIIVQHDSIELVSGDAVVPGDVE